MRVYIDDLVEVRTTWTGWRVIDRQTGAQVFPARAMQDKLGKAWVSIKRDTSLAPAHRDWAERVLLQSFGLAACHPSSEIVRLFDLPVDHIVEAMIGEAIERMKLVGSWQR